MEDKRNACDEASLEGVMAKLDAIEKSLDDTLFDIRKDIALLTSAVVLYCIDDEDPSLTGRSLFVIENIAKHARGVIEESKIG